MSLWSNDPADRLVLQARLPPAEWTAAGGMCGQSPFLGGTGSTHLLIEFLVGRIVTDARGTQAVLR
jgi:hypothetical protein